MDREIMTRKEAAEYIGISLAAFAKLQNEIPHIKLGKSVRFFKKHIDEFLERKVVNDETQGS